METRSSFVTYTTSKQDSLALVNLYDSCGGANWKEHTNWLTKSPLSTWFGVRSIDSGRVTILKLGSNNLTGRLPTSVGNLNRLHILDLDSNNLTGHVPLFTNFSSLFNIDLSNNQLTGSIPDSFGRLSNLTQIDISHNQLTGENTQLNR